jgi:hypothetical protein
MGELILRPPAEPSVLPRWEMRQTSDGPCLCRCAPDLPPACEIWSSVSDEGDAFTEFARSDFTTPYSTSTRKVRIKVKFSGATVGPYVVDVRPITVNQDSEDSSAPATWTTDAAVVRFSQPMTDPESGVYDAAGWMECSDGDIYELPQPADIHTFTFIAGPPGSAVGNFSGALQDHQLRKSGFPAFRTSDGPAAKLYKKQLVVAGSYPGCALVGANERIYSGKWEFVPSGGELRDDPTGQHVRTFSDDLFRNDDKTVGLCRFPLHWFARELTFGTVTETETSRTMDRSYLCGGETRTELLTLVLSNPYETAEFEAVVQANLDYQVDHPIFVLSSGITGATVALHRMSVDETLHHRRESQLTFGVGFAFGGAFEQRVFANTGDIINQPITYRIRKYDLAGGTVTESTNTIFAAITADNGGAAYGPPGVLGSGSISPGHSMVATTNTKWVIDQLTCPPDPRIGGLIQMRLLTDE